MHSGRKGREGTKQSLGENFQILIFLKKKSFQIVIILHYGSIFLNHVFIGCYFVKNQYLDEVKKVFCRFGFYINIFTKYDFGRV